MATLQNAVDSPACQGSLCDPLFSPHHTETSSLSELSHRAERILQKQTKINEYTFGFLNTTASTLFSALLYLLSVNIMEGGFAGMNVEKVVNLFSKY